MGGDHKCPVCQATFTRPQHVARHMRSHTGDRPYKCQYCGDQFARSDLLSRHVNKCHANEKPVVNTTARRKGSASTSRATTSKQACDQCVQSSLPCDGCNPCTKCVQRKARCTYVKFHRQTAPVGPGHNPRPAGQGQQQQSSSVPGPGLGGPSASPTSTSASAASRYPLYAEDFSSASTSSPAYAPQHQVSAALHEALYPSSAYPFAPIYPTSSPADVSTAEYASKFRGAQDDLYRSSSAASVPPGSAPGSTSSSWAGSASGWPAPVHQPASSSSSSNQHAYQQQYHLALPPQQQHEDMPIYMRRQAGVAIGPATATTSSGATGAETIPAQSFREIFSDDFAPRRGSLGQSDSGSESGLYLGETSGRKRSFYYDDASDQPSPFSFDPGYHQQGRPRYEYSDSGGSDSRPDSSSFNLHHPHSHPPGTASSSASSSSGAAAGLGGGGGRGQVFNAFGSLTIDDPNNVLAGLQQAAAAAATTAAPGPGGTAAGVATADDGSPFFANMTLEQLSAAAAAAGVPFPLPQQLPGGGDSAVDPDATPMPVKEEDGGVGQQQGQGQQGQGPRIQRPVSSMAALPSSSSSGSGAAAMGWDGYMGMGTTGWTPGAYGMGLALAGLGEAAGGGTPGAAGRDVDSKEVREFWKQYLRTPLTTAGGTESLGEGGGGEKAAIRVDSTAQHQQQQHFRRPRVASMPSSRTPMGFERDRMAGAYQEQNPYHHHQSLGLMSSVRTTLGHHGGREKGVEDLTSYEQAVMARKTPMNLTMGRLSNRRKAPSAAASSAACAAMGPGASYHHHGAGHVNPAGFAFHPQQVNVPGSDESASATSGSAGAPSPAVSRASSLSLDAEGSRPSSSAGSSYGSGAGVGAGAGVGGRLQRPSAKRLASSVLVSGMPKAMKYDWDGGSGGVGVHLQQQQFQHGQGQGQGQLPQLVTQGLEGSGVYRGGSGMMMASAPPREGSVLNLNLSRSGSGSGGVQHGGQQHQQQTLAERRRASVGVGMMGDVGGGRNRSMSDAH